MANSEYRLSVVVAELGAQDVAEEHMEQFIDGFEATHPGAGAVMAANFRLETLDATFTVEAENAREAVEVGGDAFCDAATATGIPPTEILEIKATRLASTRHGQLTEELSFA